MISALIVMSIYSDTLDSINNALFDTLIPFLELGLLGILLTSVVGTSLLFIQVPYYLLVYEFTLVNRELSFMIAAALVMGVSTVR